MAPVDLVSDLRQYIARFGRLNLPDTQLRIAREPDGIVRVYDRLRRRTVALTPEEWVRQHFVAMMITQLGFPEGMMANEVPISLNGTSRRCDTVVYSPQGLRPLMIVEYKAPAVAISQHTFDQIVRYNMALQVPWLAVSNGISHYCCRVDYDRKQVEFQRELPNFADLTN